MARQFASRSTEPPGRAPKRPRTDARVAPARPGLLQLQQTIGNRALARRLGVGQQRAASGDAEASTAAPAGRSGGLPARLRAGLEALSGLDLGDVRVHYDSTSPDRLQALAFTRGREIHLGAGHERHLPHEAWHVVQQMQGRVRATAAVNGVAINDDAALEREADAMGARALRPPAAVAPRAAAGAAEPRPVAQRAVTTFGGSWDTHHFDLLKDVNQKRQPVPPAVGARGVDIQVEFTPGASVDAELIGLTQSVQAFVAGTASYTGPTNKSMSIKAGDAIKIGTGTNETDEGTAIDRAAPFNNPIYAVKTTPSSSLDDPNTAPGWGQHGWRYVDGSKKLQKRKATLKDIPMRPGAQKNSRHVFETAALATKGAQAGTYYGSVRWGWRTDDKENFTKIPLAKVSDGVPSSTFMKAAAIWNVSKSSTSASTVNLPLVDVQVIKSPGGVTLTDSKPTANLKLPDGTRVKILDATHLYEPSATTTDPYVEMYQIEVVDGPHTRETGWVNYRRVKDERS